MCLVLFALKEHDKYPFIFAANRDERHTRPTTEAQFWGTAPDILAGQDDEKGGTWCGVTVSGRFAAVTNIRAPDMQPRNEARSRGYLVRDYLLSERSAETFVAEVEQHADKFNGFNFLAGQVGEPELYYVTNGEANRKRIEKGTYGLSNQVLGIDWPKVVNGREALTDLISRENTIVPADLLEILGNRDLPPDDQLPNTGLPLDKERRAGAAFVLDSEYGTRSSTVILGDSDGELRFVERYFDADGEEVTTVRESFSLEKSG